MIRALVVLTLILGGEVWVPRPPLGLDLYMPVAETNPLSRAKAAQGREFFFDRRLSRDGSLACASCHDPKLGFSDGRRVARGIGGADGSRNSPALINRGYGTAFFWDGRAASLERQAIEPILNPKELGITAEELETRTGMKAADVAAALASYVRTIRSGNSPYDRFAAGKTGALNALEKSGLRLFRGKAGCSSCHIGPSFTDERFHNTGVAWLDGRLADEGRGGITGNEKDRGAFKTPTLREVARTAPYMHDGSLATLEDVVRFYSDGGRRNPYLDPQIQPKHFTPEETRALVAFLRTLSGQVLEGVR
jgi:cytochrome c peroxidase